MEKDLLASFLSALENSFYAIIPLIVIVLIIQFTVLKLPIKQLLKNMYALFFVFLGLVLFLYGVDISFVSAGSKVGEAFGLMENKLIVVIISFILGLIVTLAEPAVSILNNQIENITSGYINKKVVLIFISIGVAFSLVFSIIRIYTGISLLYFLLPGYALVFILSRYVSTLFLAIAIDSGGVVTGPMIATVLLAITVSMSNVIERSNPLLDGFGMIALVSLMPILSIMILGLIYEKAKAKGGY